MAVSSMVIATRKGYKIRKEVDDFGNVAYVLSDPKGDFIERSVSFIKLHKFMHDIPLKN